MASKRWQWGVSIAGFGDVDLELLGEPIRLSYAARRVVGSARYVRGVYNGPRKIKTECEPLEGLTTQGTITIEFGEITKKISSTPGTRYGPQLLQYLWTPNPLADATLDGVLNDSATSFVILMNAGATEPAVGDFIRIGREVCSIANVSVGAANQRTITVDARGGFGTDAEQHTPLDNFVYLNTNPIKVDRELIIHLLDLDTDTESEIFRGVIEGRGLSDGNNLLRVKARDALGRAGRRKLGNGRWTGALTLVRGILNNRNDVLYVYNNSAPGNPVQFTPLLADHPFDSYKKCLPVAIDGQAHLVTANSRPSAGQPYLYQVEIGIGEAYSLDGQRLDPGDPSRAKRYTVKEILFCDADNSASLIRDDAGDRSDHPADIIRNILCSTGSATWPSGGSHTVGSNGDYDWLPGQWGLGLPDSLIDHDAFDLLRERFPTGAPKNALNQRLGGIRAQSFYCGADDSETPALEVVFDLAQCMSCYIYLLPDGRISIRHLSDPGILGVDQSVGVSEIKWTSGAEAGVETDIADNPPIYAIKMECAQRGPGGDPGQYVDAGDLRRTQLQRFRYLAKRDLIKSTRCIGSPKLNALDSYVLSALLAAFASRYEYTQEQLPIYTVKLNGSAPIITAGQWISLTDPTLIDVDGSRGITNHRCLVLTQDLDLSPVGSSYEQTLTVVDWAPVSPSTSLISPAWRVTAVTSSKVFEVATAAPQGFSDDDFQWLQTGAGYEYELWSSVGVLRSTATPGQILSLSSPQITMLVEFGDGAAVTPSVGDIIRIARYDDRGDWDNVYPQTWISDDDAELGTAGDDAYKWSP